MKKLFTFFFLKHGKKTLVITFIFAIWYYHALPKQLFTDPTSTVLEAQDGTLLGAKIAKDGQWRFPALDSVPEKFAIALTQFEDKRFYYHFGIDPIGILRAVKENVQNRKIVSGGSTLTMQVLRMARKSKSRTLWQKLIEAVLATRLELASSKKDILAMYASNAPFGGNVVGLEAASWRYYGKKPMLLTWGEAATLAVLPNSPGLVHPGRNRSTLRSKRNELLDVLLDRSYIDSLSWELAKEETLPEAPLRLPRLSPHLLERAYTEQLKGKPGIKTRVKTTINPVFQERMNQILSNQHNYLAGQDIHNLAAIIVETQTGKVLAYGGNILKNNTNHGGDVDIIKAPRSTGSILKPFLYALMLHEGTILPNTIISDIPMFMSGYKPQNFFASYDGVVKANRAISRSLNVPLVRMLQQYGLEKFHFYLKKLGITTLNHPATHYGMPLILGGAEANLWDLVGIYSSMGRILTTFTENSSQYLETDLHKLSYVEEQASHSPTWLSEPPYLGAGAIWSTFEAMRELERPNSEGSWEFFSSSQTVAWKTGTSFGFRDAWAIGLTPEYTIGVWVGNADGEGRPGLVGVRTAGPVLFDLFGMVPHTHWFDQPFDDMVHIPVCPQSGMRALPICQAADSSWVPSSGVRAAACKYHQLVHLNKEETARVNSNCYLPSEMKHLPWFILPPVEEMYFRSRKPDYRLLPPIHKDCKEGQTDKQMMEWIYPQTSTKIYVPRGLDGQLSRTIFKIAHRKETSKVFWHLDNTYLGSTTNFHSFELAPSAGKHIVTVVDEQGATIAKEFEILEKENN